MREHSIPLSPLVPGTSVKPPAPPPEELEKPRSERVELRRLGRWIKGKPQVGGHYSERYKEYVRHGPARVAVFDLAKPADLVKYNALIARAYYPPGGDGPPITLLREDPKVVVGDRWLCCLVWCDIFYREIIVRSTTVTDDPS